MSQMKYRSLEGQGTCTYKIGLEDNGKPLGLNESDMLESSSNICEMAS
jgi:GTPase